MILFDREFHFKQLCRAQKKFHRHNFIHDYISQNIYDKIIILNQKFKDGLVSGYLNADLEKIIDNVTYYNYGEIDEEVLPQSLLTNKYDLIISNLSLHYVNNFPQVLNNFQSLLNKKGVFLATFFGGETLKELRIALQNAEIKIFNGVSPRVIPMIEIKDAARLIQNSAFKNPVSEIETIEIVYDDFFKLLADIRGMGQSNSLFNRNKISPGKSFFKEAEKIYWEEFSQNDKIIATFEVITIFGEN